MIMTESKEIKVSEIRRENDSSMYIQGEFLGDIHMTELEFNTYKSDFDQFDLNNDGNILLNLSVECSERG